MGGFPPLFSRNVSGFHGFSTVGGCKIYQQNVLLKPWNEIGLEMGIVPSPSIQDIPFLQQNLMADSS